MNFDFHDFSITQIICEINFGDSTSTKCAILTLLEALNFDLYAFLHFLKAEIYQITKIQSSPNAKNDSFRFLEIDFT